MTELYYNKSRMVWVLLGGLALTAGAAWLAVAHPVPEGNGRYAALYDLLGPTGVELVFAAAALMFAGGSIAVAVYLCGDGVAARITPRGLMLHQWWGDLEVAWRDFRGFGDKVMHVRGREHRFLVIHFAPRRMGPFTRRKTSLMHGHLLGDGRDVEAWAEAALAAAAAAANTTPAPTPARGFGRRGLAG